jgi:hypothetical protein
MSDWITETNIRVFKEKNEREADPHKRRILEELLAKRTSEAQPMRPERGACGDAPESVSAISQPSPAWRLALQAFLPVM